MGSIPKGVEAILSVGVPSTVVLDDIDNVVLAAVVGAMDLKGMKEPYSLIYPKYSIYFRMAVYSVYTEYSTYFKYESRPFTAAWVCGVQRQDLRHLLPELMARLDSASGLEKGLRWGRKRYLGML